MLHEQAGHGALNIVRRVVFGVWLLLVATTPLHELADLPSEMFNPVGALSLLPGAFWDGFMAPVPLTAFRLCLTLLLGVIVIGAPRRRGLALLAVAGLLLFDGMLKSHGGFINHARFALLYTAVLLSLVPAQQGDATRSDAVRPGNVLRLASLLLAVAYTLIGLHRLFIGRATIFLDDSLATYVMLRTFEPAAWSFQLGYLAVGSGVSLLALKAGFFVTTVAEVASPFAVFHRRIRLVWLAIIVPFHFATLFTMNIFFWENLILIGLLFTDLPTRIEAWGKQGRSTPIASFDPDRTRRHRPRRRSSDRPGRRERLRGVERTTRL